MRLHLVILRHGLPATRVLWTVGSRDGASHTPSVSASTSITRLPVSGLGGSGYTISQLLEGIDEVVPLESFEGVLGENEADGGQWGLEDYAVEVNGFECLHFMPVDGLLRDGDEVVIRALGVDDIRARRLSGRLQVSTDGRRLIDGVPFGRLYHSMTRSSRPSIRIPPRKKRRTTLSAWTGNIDNDEFQLAPYDNDEYAEDSPHSTVVRRRVNRFEEEDEEDEEDDDDDDDGIDETELAEELKSLRKDAELEKPFFDSPDFQRFRAAHAGRMSRMAHRDQLLSSSPARLPIVSTPRPNPARRQETVASAKSTSKSSRSVHFEADISNFTSRSSEKSDSDSDEEFQSPASSVVSGDSSESSMESSNESDDDDDDDEEEEEKEEEEDASSAESDVESSNNSSSSVSGESESESEPDSEDEGAPVKKKNRKINVFTPPGDGSRKTRNSNRRKKLRARLQKLKSLGELPPEANFEDLKAWEVKHGKRPLTEVTDIGDQRGKRKKEESDIEIRRQKLLQGLASGGIDIDAYSEKENIPPRNRNDKRRNVGVDQQITESSTSQKFVEGSSNAAQPEEEEEEAAKTSPSEIKRRKLDLPSTKRMLFNSLGVRSPKTQEDEEALRKSMNENRAMSLSKETPGSATVEKIADRESDDENWQDKIVLSATECVFDDVELTAPPFPFQQRWDRDASYIIRQRKKNSQNTGPVNKKRKQRDCEVNGEYTGHQDSASYDTDVGGIILNYDDPPHQTQQVSQAGESRGDIVDDLLVLPNNVDELPDLTYNEVKEGAIIAYKHLLMSKATGWQPQVSNYKVARVSEIRGNGTFDVVLAKRDREGRKERNMNEDGERQYSGFEMPDDDDDEDNETEDDGLRSVSLQDIMEPKLMQAAVGGETGESEAKTSTSTSASAKENHDETSILTHPHHTASALHSSTANEAASVAEADNELPPLPAVAAVATVSSQTRLEIANMIYDAGFRSAIDSELERLPVTKERDERVDLTVDSQRENQLVQDKIASSQSEVASSPPVDEPEIRFRQSDDNRLENRHLQDTFAESPAMGQMTTDMEDDEEEDDAGFRIDVDDDFVMSDHHGFDADDQSDDGIPLPQLATPRRKGKEGLANNAASGHRESHTSTSPRVEETNLQQTPRKTGKETETQPRPDLETESAEKEADKSFLSTTVRAASRSFTDPAAVDKVRDSVSKEKNVNREDCGSLRTGSHPCNERDAATQNKTEPNTAETPATSREMRNLGPASSRQLRAELAFSSISTNRHEPPKSNQEADQVLGDASQSDVNDTGNEKLDFDMSWLNDDGSDASEEPDFPDIEVLWASTAPTQKEFPPIKLERSEPAVDQGHEDPVRTASSSVAPQLDEAPLYPCLSENSAVGEDSERVVGRQITEQLANNVTDDNNGPASFKASSSLQQSPGFRSQQPAAGDDEHDDVDDNDAYQHSADNSSHSGFHEQQEESQDVSIPIVDLTASSPLVSPNQSSDEDFAKSLGLPRGPGWVKKNVPTTGRRTRSSAGGRIMLSSSISPPQRVNRRFTQSQG